MRVRVERPDGGVEEFILRIDRYPHGVEIESRLLPLLARLGLPVPSILAGPAVDPQNPALGSMTVTTVLPGHDVLEWCWQSEGKDHEWVDTVVLDAVARLQGATPQLRDHPAAAGLPTRRLLDEILLLEGDASLWFQEAEVRSAFPLLRALATDDPTPLVFSNGDFNPANILSDGRQLTGLVDFSWSCFEDPHFGLAKYVTFDWLPFCPDHLLRRYCEEQKVSPEAWSLRTATACLWSLRQVPHAQENAAKASNLMDKLKRALRDCSL